MGSWNGRPSVSTILNATTLESNMSVSLNKLTKLFRKAGAAYVHSGNAFRGG